MLNRNEFIEQTIDINNSNAIKTLVRLGLSKNEAKTYIGLLELGETEATPLATHTKLPQPKIYSYLEGLIGKNIIGKIELQGKPTLYYGFDHEEIMRTLKNKFENQYEITQSYFKQLKAPKIDRNEYFKLTIGKQEVKKMIRRIIREAEENIYIIKSDYYSALLDKTLTELKQIRKDRNLNKIRIIYVDEIAQSVYSSLPPIVRNVINQIFSQSFPSYPCVIINDVNVNSISAKNINIITPQSISDEAIGISIYHPLIIRFQVSVLLSWFRIIENSTKGQLDMTKSEEYLHDIRKIKNDSFLT